MAYERLESHVSSQIFPLFKIFIVTVGKKRFNSYCRQRKVFGKLVKRVIE